MNTAASMSKTETLLNCQWWANPAMETPRGSVGEPARYGSAWHALMAWRLSNALNGTAGYSMLESANADLKKYNSKANAADLVEHVEDAFGVLWRWLSGDNLYDVDFTTGLHNIRVECGYVLNMKTGRSRPLIMAVDEETHVYPGVDYSIEFPGTLDVLIFPERSDTAIVIDHKTGEDFNARDQLRSQALAVMRDRGTPKRFRIDTAVFHANARSIPTLYPCETLWGGELELHAAKLREAFARRTEGSLRPGSYCQYCPAFSICPTQSTALSLIGKKPGAMTVTPRSLGEMHMRVQEMEQHLEDWRAMARDWVEQNGPGMRPDGKLVDITEHEEESLSKKSVTDALGKVEGEKLIEDLRQRGCVKKITKRSLKALRESGR